MERNQLEQSDIKQISELIDELVARFGTAEHHEFLGDTKIYAHELPRNLRRLLNNFRLIENESGGIIVNFPIDDEEIGPTPSHWRHERNHLPVIRYEFLMVLCAGLLGDPMGWKTQQAGYIVHEVVPIREHENEQVGFSSQELLDWHTEDAFHPYRPDYLSLLCLRNPTHTPTTLSQAAKLDLSDSIYDVLFEDKFTIRPDNSHQADTMTRETELDVDFSQIEKMNERPDPISVLFGDRDQPYLRLDPYFMERPQEEIAARAFDKLVAQLASNLTEVVLQPGDLLFIDNYRTVHGRRPFKANYDGRDRWLKRVNITRDLRKSRELRGSASSPILV